MAEAFVKTFKRDYVRITALQGADTALALIENWMEDYNTVTRTRDWVTVHPASTSLHNRNPLCVRSDRVKRTIFLLEHLVSGGEQRGRHREASGLADLRSMRDICLAVVCVLAETRSDRRCLVERSGFGVRCC